MQVVIEIHENLFNALKDNDYIPYDRPIKDAIIDGIILPKNHGRLIDADALKKAYKSGNWDLHKVLDGAETIIEAESEVRNEDRQGNGI